MPSTYFQHFTTLCYSPNQILGLQTVVLACKTGTQLRLCCSLTPQTVIYKECFCFLPKR